MEKPACRVDRALFAARKSHEGKNRGFQPPYTSVASTAGMGQRADTGTGKTPGKMRWLSSLVPPASLSDTQNDIDG
ncbi:MAG: hypothetical protein WAW46_03045 [Polaromonas sp.]